MFGDSVKSKYCFIYILLLLAITGGAGRVAAFQNGEKSINPWEKPIAKCWSYEADTVYSVPIVSDKKHHLYIPLADGAIAAVDTVSGKQVWRSGLGGEIRAIERTEIGQLIVLTEQESEKKDDKSLFLQALSEETGVTVWRREIDADIKNVVVAGEAGVRLVFDRKTGEPPPVFIKQTDPTAPADRFHSVTVAGGAGGDKKGDLMIYSDAYGAVYAERSSSEVRLWKARAGAEVTDITVTGRGLVISSADNFVYMLSVNRGDRKWKRKFSGKPLGAPVIHENYGLFVTVAGTEAVVLDLTNGKFVNSITLPDSAFFTGGAVGVEKGFALATSQGILFYAPDGCAK